MKLNQKCVVTPKGIKHFTNALSAVSGVIESHAICIYDSILQSFSKRNIYDRHNVQVI